MVAIPYGFDATFPNAGDDPWTRLTTINEYMESCEPIPPDLAQWLGHAIWYSNGDANELLRRLGLKRGRGRIAHKHKEDAWLEWGGRIYRREASGERAEQAIVAVMREYAESHGEEPSRADCQKWRNTYHAAKSV